MDKEEIRQLGRDYAMETIGRPNTAWIEEYGDFLAWLSREHCIVSREKAKALCRLTNEFHKLWPGYNANGIPICLVCRSGLVAGVFRIIAVR